MLVPATDRPLPLGVRLGPAAFLAIAARWDSVPPKSSGQMERRPALSSSAVRDLVRGVIGEENWTKLRHRRGRLKGLRRRTAARVEQRRILREVRGAQEQDIVAAVVKERKAVDSVRAMSGDLIALAKHFGTDKWGAHRYAQHYQRHFAPLRDRPLTLLEIGIGGYSRSGQGGASLRMWKHYFPRGAIYGLDIHDKSFVEEPRIRTFRGDQSDPDLLAKIVAEIGPPDIVIDDGSHQVKHVLATFEILFPMLAPDGIYVVEDTQTSYWPEYGGAESPDDPHTSMARLKALVDGLNYEEFVAEDHSASYTDLHVTGAHYYHNLVVIEKGINREGTRKKAILKKRYAD